MTSESRAGTVPHTPAEENSAPVATEDDRLIERWAKVLSGQECPTPLAIPAEAHEAVDRALRGREVLPTERQRILNSFALQYYYRGKEIACLRTENKIAVLAVGSHQVGLLLRHFSPEQCRHVTIEYPPIG